MELNIAAFPLVTFDDDGIMAVFTTAQDFYNSLEPQFLEEITGIYDGAGTAYKVRLKSSSQVELVPSTAQAPLASRVKEFTYRWTDLDPGRTPEDEFELREHLIKVLSATDLRRSPRRT